MSIVELRMSIKFITENFCFYFETVWINSKKFLGFFMAKVKKEKVEKKKIGRPSIYTEELGDEICCVVGRSKEGLEHLCQKNSHWPNPNTIYEWRIKNAIFGEKYALAKGVQADLLVDELLEIADDSDKDTIKKINNHGEEYEVCNSEWVNRSRLRVDTRKWIASKLAPKFYGEKLQTEVTNLTQIKTMSDIVTAYKGLSENDRKAVIEDMIRIEDIEEIKTETA